jgi:2-polyprenyl-3-methyl-5-hydroxy-6-metoxy-1,4-benzoquinol methylase
MADKRYPHVDRFSKSIGIPSENLIKAFEIEKMFHAQILAEQSFEKRRKMYEDVFNTVHPIYGKDKTKIMSGRNPKDNIVRLFSKELRNKSVLDIGCGEGYFLASISRNLPHKKLVGIDVSIPVLPQNHPDIEFKLENIVNFNLYCQFDVVFSDQVLEHIAPEDINIHLSSVVSALKTGGIFIINMPNRLFGPSDVSRIIDFTYTNKISALGTHLNESTYTELIPILKQNGFTNFKTVCFIPKLKNILFNYRISPSILKTIERSPLILKLLHNIKLNGRCIAIFGITLICTKY